MKNRFEAEVLPTHTPALFAAAVQRAAQLLRAGELVALPTETVYGLAANAFDETAVMKIFDTKGRPSHNPLIVHVSNLKMAGQCAAEWPGLAQKLATAFWPGPLTIILPRSERIADVVTAGGNTVGVRWPQHPFIQAVIEACGFPLAAPSANLSNEISPPNARHVQKALGNKIPLIIDGGQSQVGIESTVFDLTSTPPRLLRPGMIHAESLLAVTGELTLGFGESEEILRSPGLLKKHYSPNAVLTTLSWRNEPDLEAQVFRFASQNPRLTERLKLSEVHVIAHTVIPLSEKFGRVSVIPHDAEAFARAIYAELHLCDEGGARLIVMEELPNTEAWRAVRDRVQRASAE